MYLYILCLYRIQHIQISDHLLDSIIRFFLSTWCLSSLKCWQYILFYIQTTWIQVESKPGIRTVRFSAVWYPHVRIVFLV
jgi:hypothetical protein